MKKAGDGDSLELVKFIDLMSASEVNLTEKDLSRYVGYLVESLKKLRNHLK